MGVTCSLFPLHRQLSLLLNAENIFHSMADILLREEDLKFASTMVQNLNSILLTSSELFQLRSQLKDLQTPVCPGQMTWRATKFSDVNEPMLLPVQCQRIRELG